MAVTGRRGARRLLVQALYQHQLAGHSRAELESQFCRGDDFGSVDGDYFRALLAEILEGGAALDELLAPELDRPVAQLDPVPGERRGARQALGERADAAGGHAAPPAGVRSRP